MNQNDYALVIAEREGGRVSLSIAQIKEVLRIDREFFLEKTGIDKAEVLKKV